MARLSKRRRNSMIAWLRDTVRLVRSMTWAERVLIGLSIAAAVGFAVAVFWGYPGGGVR